MCSNHFDKLLLFFFRKAFKFISKLFYIHIIIHFI